MSKKNVEAAKSALVFEVDPTECPFREFRDNELSTDYWGLGPSAFRAALLTSKGSKPPPDLTWVDDQAQPLPRSVRQYLNGWVRAEDLAMDRWGAGLVVFEESNGGSKMCVADIQLSHTQVLTRSAFCRTVLSTCFMLERVDGLMMEHQWENFTFSMGPEGWRARYHIYSPGMKPGGGAQHRPGLSRNGCYLVRLFYVGLWRCVWVNDLVPVDAADAPLLPFSPLTRVVPARPGVRSAPAAVTAGEVELWPLLICKALLKLAAPDMSGDVTECGDDEEMPEFDVTHALTGCMDVRYQFEDSEDLWSLLKSEIPLFVWENDDDTQASTIRTKSTKKPANKETIVARRSSTGMVVIADTKDYPPYALPGITPGHEMSLLVTMARDLPLKKPLPEPEVSPWKHHRWVEWARGRGLYEAYECPRTRFLKVNGLMKLSHAPHLLDVQSTESITFGFREEHDKTPAPQPKKSNKPEAARSQTGAASTLAAQMKEELRQWILFESLSKLIKSTNIVYFPSMFEFTSAASSPPIRITKTPNRSIDISAPKYGPLYLQIDSPNENLLKISLAMLHPRVMVNSGIPILDEIELAHLILEKFDWFEDNPLPVAKGFVKTEGYDSVEVRFVPGRHYCRLWVHSRLNWHVMLLSESTLLLGSRDIVQTASVRECPWAARFLSSLSAAFTNWIRVNRSNPAILSVDREFYRSYQPDLEWNNDVIGYNKTLLHWMFRQALQSLLKKRLFTFDFRTVCAVLRRYFCDPDFGFPPKSDIQKSFRDIANLDPCDCMMPEAEEFGSHEEESLVEQTVAEEPPRVDPITMMKLLSPAKRPITSQVCELATEEMPCGILKDERDKVIKKHEAATVIQAYWRGVWARKCLNVEVLFTQEVLKMVMDNAFGNPEALSALMNEFFFLYPTTRSAYSVASALTGVTGASQYSGVSTVTPRCKWIPYFQGVFYCHAPVKAHFDIQGSLPHSTAVAYNNDTGETMPQAYNSHKTFDFTPNNYGYTVMAHGTLSQPLGHNHDVHWQFTVLSSIQGAFHLCDNDYGACKELTMQPSYKLHIDEMFLPNRRNILGGLLVSVTKHEAVSFRAAASSTDLEMVATLRCTRPSGEVEEISRCTGRGEIYWPYITLRPDLLESTAKKRSTSHANLRADSTTISSRSLKSLSKAPKPGSAKSKSSNTKLKDQRCVPTEPKQYSIEVTAREGWPLTIGQWKRVDEVRNSIDLNKHETPKKPAKVEKPTSAKEKDKSPPTSYQPQPDDAYIELECSLSVAGGSYARRDDVRDQEFIVARKSWDAKEIGRNMRGAQIRKDFRAEFLEATPLPPSESSHITEEMLGEVEGEEDKTQQTQQGPTPATESGMLEMTVESEEEPKYLQMPEQLRDKFIPLYFLPFCTQEVDDDKCVIMTPVLAEAAKGIRHALMEVAIEKMRILQEYNEFHVIGRQRRRCKLVETLFVESHWSPELAEVLEERDEVIAQETLNRTLSANKKKQDSKKKLNLKK